MLKKGAPRIEKKDTSFGLCLIEDKALMPAPGLIVVRNLPDRRPAGKPAGFGLPGGGRKRSEGLEEAITREWLDETGLRPEFVYELEEIEERFFIIMDKSTVVINDDGYPEGEMKKRIFFRNSARFEPRYRPRTEEVLENVIHIFKVRIGQREWQDGRLRSVFQKRREELAVGGAVPSDLELLGGIFVQFGGDADAATLGIEEGMDAAGQPAEVDGIAIVPASVFSPDTVFRNPLLKDFYRSHIRRLVKAVPLLLSGK